MHKNILGMIILPFILTACFGNADQKSAENKPPVAQFKYDGEGLGMDFFDTSTDVDGKIVKWAWDFGNGYDDEIQNPELTYRGPGTFEVKLTVTDDQGATATTSQIIDIKLSGAPTPGKK